MKEIVKLQRDNTLLSSECRKLKEKYLSCCDTIKDLKDQLKLKNDYGMKQISEEAEGGNEKAILIIDLVRNFYKKKSIWSETTLRMCTMWRFTSPKGYRFCYQNVLKIPSKSTISRYIGKAVGFNDLIKHRLQAETASFKAPVQRVCSLIIDDMAIKEKINYSKAEDYIYGLETCISENEIGNKPKIANKMLCFVLHGLSTRYSIPAGYYFHGSMSAKTLYKLTMDVLKLATDCGFVVLRIVTDNFSSNVALFKLLGNGALKNYIDHPFLKPIPLFLSFDYCHTIKNARNLFLSREMCSSEGLISSTYLKTLHDLQVGLPIKPVKFLTNKHLYPSNLEKMNVLRAIQVFSPAVTSALQFLKDCGDERFSNCQSTISYMQNMHHFFLIHNVSNTKHYIHSLNSNAAPYINISDERLQWLDTIFPNYIDNIQTNSAINGLPGLTAETSTALKFTAKSTCFTVKYLLQEVGFYYVLTRAFSSDAVEATFAHVRLLAGSNDATDARAAEYGMRHIIQCGLFKVSKSANIIDNMSSISTISLSVHQKSLEQNRKRKPLPQVILNKIQYLRTHTEAPGNDIFSVSVAYFAGYIITKIERSLKCDQCVSPFLSKSVPGPLMQLISLQNRGGLLYPNKHFVGLVLIVVDTIQAILPHLENNKIVNQLQELILPHLVQNPLMCCTKHRTEVCNIIIKLASVSVLSNKAIDITEQCKSLKLEHKPISRKVLKL